MSLFNRVGKLISGKILEAKNHEVQHEIVPEVENPGELLPEDSQNMPVGIEDFSHRRGTMSAASNDDETSEQRERVP